MKYRWSLATSRHPLLDELSRELAVSALTAQCLINRGIESAAEADLFLTPRLKRLADPFQLPQMSAAVDRLFLARERQESCVIFGDYDVDGVTATALLETGLRNLGWCLRHYLPHRRDEGYGLSRVGLENCLERGPVSLLIAVDCGSTSTHLIGWLRASGIDVIVLDHHQVASPPPPACALVNPQMNPPGNRHGQELCSAGIVFKLLHAVMKRGRDLGLPNFGEFDLKAGLDLVTLGTVADLVPLTGENRILVHAGLKRLELTQRPGLMALKEVAKTRSPITTYEVGFQLGPRLNAAGRLETAEAALELLMASNADNAQPLAEALDDTNRDRQGIERQITESALAIVREKFNPAQDFVIVEGSDSWHLGVVGIVASRVAREFNRPTFILGADGEGWRGSGRSIAGFDLAQALRDCHDLLQRHGGHAMAAGVSLHRSQVDAFRNRLNQLVFSRLDPSLLIPALRLDGEARVADLSLAQVEELNRLAPFGTQNPPVQLLVRNVRLIRPPQRLGREQRHWKFALSDGNQTLDALWWGAGDEPAPTGIFDVAVAPQVETFNGRTAVTLKFLDWRPIGLADKQHSITLQA